MAYEPKPFLDALFFLEEKTEALARGFSSRSKVSEHENFLRAERCRSSDVAADRHRAPPSFAP